MFPNSDVRDLIVEGKIITTDPGLPDAWIAVRDRSFPLTPRDHDLADWLFELAEVDGYLAGIAISVLGGDRSVTRPSSDELTELGDDLDHLRVATPEDEVILADCREYFAALKRLLGALRT